MEVSREVIVLRCPIMQHRLRQGCRLEACTHASCFDAAARESIRQPGTLDLRCPICGCTGRKLVIDQQLTTFLSEHAEAEHASVRGEPGAFRYALHRKRRVAPIVHLGSCSSQASDAGESVAPAPKRPSRAAAPAAAPPARRGIDPRLPKPRSGGERRALRLARREQSARAAELEAVRAELVRRALHEDTSTGEALWGSATET
jgi:hypothetical protein